MAEVVSIWRWVITEDLEELFARLIKADDAQFSAIAGEIMMEDAPADPGEVFAQAEAKVRAMGLSEAELATTLAGLKAMYEETLAEQQDWEEDAEDEPDPEGRVGVALASSHMFYQDPFASLKHEEIARQVGHALAGYRAAISKALGHEGQSMATYLGLDAEKMIADATFDTLIESGLAEVEWIWVEGGQALFLSQWHEDKELPIDLEFGRAPRAIFEAVQARIKGPYEM